VRHESFCACRVEEPGDRTGENNVFLEHRTQPHRGREVNGIRAPDGVPVDRLLMIGSSSSSNSRMNSLPQSDSNALINSKTWQS
jgi:hypothetical protein